MHFVCLAIMYYFYEPDAMTLANDVSSPERNGTGVEEVHEP